MVKHYKELRVYQRAYTASMSIFKLTKKWPRDDWSLIDQIRRSSRSVCGCMAEAWRKRRYPAHFVSKLSDSDTEAAETQVWLDMALDCGYVNKEDHAALYDDYEAVCSGLVNMMNNPDEWCGPSQLRVREEPAEYRIDAVPPTRPSAHTPTLSLPPIRPSAHPLIRKEESQP